MAPAIANGDAVPVQSEQNRTEQKFRFVDVIHRCPAVRMLGRLSLLSIPSPYELVVCQLLHEHLLPLSSIFQIVQIVEIL